MTQSIIRVADLIDALKDQPQDARVKLLVHIDHDPAEVYIGEVSYVPSFGPGKVILVGGV